MRSQRWNLLLPLTCVILQGMHTIVSKLSAGVISPEAISCYRWVVATCVLAPFLWPGFVREWAAIRKAFWHVMLLGFLGMVIYQGLVYVAAPRIEATNIAIIGSLVPVLSVLWAALLTGYRPGPRVLIGCAVSLFGVLVLSHKGDLTALTSHAPASADLIVLAGVALYALYGVLIRLWKLPIANNPFFFAQALAALLITLPGPFIGEATPLNTFNGSLVLFAGLIGSVAIPFLWMKAVQTVGPVTSGLFTNLAPLVTAAIAVTYLGEALAAYHAVGAALIIGGVVLAQSETLRAGSA